MKKTIKRIIAIYIILTILIFPLNLVTKINYTGLFSTNAAAVSSDKKVLLIQDKLPWDSNANKTVLTAIGVSYDVINTSSFSASLLSSYSTVILANDQTSSTYSAYISFNNELEKYVKNGGVVAYGACDEGWGSGYLSSTLPGGVSKGNTYTSKNYISESNHPIVTGILSDNNSLEDLDLYSNYCSHVYFIEDSLPQNSIVILRSFDNNAPTLVEYPLGKGYIIASGLTWEHNYVKHTGNDEYGTFALKALDDYFLYAISGANYLKQIHTVPDYKAKNASYADRYFNGCGLALDGAGNTPDMCIPELSESFGYIPQGIGFSDSLEKTLITSYYKKSNKDKGQKTYPSKLFCLDDDGNLTSAYDIKTSNGNYCYGHVGGVAAYADYIYIANGSKIYCVPLSNLNEEAGVAISSEEKDLSSLLKSSKSEKSASCSYVTVTDGILWTGNFFYAKKDDYNTPASDSCNSLIYGFELNSDGTFDGNNPKYKINVNWKGENGKTIDRIQGASVKDGKIYMNTSLGKGNDGILYVVDNINLDRFLVHPPSGSSIQVESSVKRYKSLPMSQGMFFRDGYMYTLSESGAYYYIKEKADTNPTDVVWKIDYEAMEDGVGYPETTGDITIPQSIYFSDSGTNGYTDVVFKQSWFKYNSKKYNHELGQFCSQLAMVGYGKKSEIATALNKIGFIHDDFSVNGKNYSCINKQTAKEQVNYFISHKNINVNGKTFTLIFAGFIGSYQDQWYSNFDPGTGETHKGFKNAKEYVYEILQAYMTYLNTDYNNTKILVTGHSRGAATANLVAAQLIKDNQIADENIYAYTFATPNVTTLSEKDNAEYKRIFNIVNPEDFVTKCMPNAWGYGRYGITYTLPSKTNTSEYDYYKRNMQEYYTDFTDGDTYSNFVTGEFATWEVIEAMTLLIRNINQFYVSYLSAGVIPMSPYSFFKNTLCRFVSNTASTTEKAEALALVTGTLALSTSSKLYRNILVYFLYGGDIVSDQFVDAHWAQTYCAFMMSMSEFDLKTTRTGLHHSVNCPVDVEIIDKTTGEVVGRIVNNVIDEEIAAKDNSVVITVDGDSKQFWLPADGYYDVILTGNDDGKMDYSVSEVDSDYGEIKRSNFFDVEITDGDSMTGIPEVEEASLNDYNLNLGDEETLDSTAIIETEDLRQIDINTASYGQGMVTESQTATSGDYIILNAVNIEDSNSEFYGWYDGETLISSELTYAFVAKDNVNIKAEFERIAGDSNGDNTVNSFDALRALQSTTETIELNSFEEIVTDVNGDGDIDSLDALMILQYSVGLITDFEYTEE